MVRPQILLKTRSNFLKYSSRIFRGVLQTTSGVFLRNCLKIVQKCFWVSSQNPSGKLSIKLVYDCPNLSAGFSRNPRKNSPKNFFDDSSETFLKILLKPFSGITEDIVEALQKPFGGLPKSHWTPLKNNPDAFSRDSTETFWRTS